MEKLFVAFSLGVVLKVIFFVMEISTVQAAEVLKVIN